MITFELEYGWMVDFSRIQFVFICCIKTLQMTVSVVIMKQILALLPEVQKNILYNHQEFH